VTNGSQWRWNDIIIDSATRADEQFSMALAPTSDDTTTGWTPSTGATIYGVVDEIPFASSDYAEATANNDEIRLGHTALPSGVTVTGASVIAYFARDGAIVDLNLMVESNAATTYAGAVAGGSGGTYNGYTAIIDIDPDTAAAWTVAGLDAALIGARIET
jgi:hypothetical protein